MLRWCFFLSNKLDIFYFVTGISIIQVGYLHFFGLTELNDIDLVCMVRMNAWPAWPKYWTMWLPESPPGTQGRTSLTSGGHFRDELLPEDSSLCLNVLSARLNNLNICFYFVGRGKRIHIFLSKIISLADFFWIWCILWKASVVNYNWFFDIF